MFYSTELTRSLHRLLFWAAQSPVLDPSQISPAQASVVTAGPRFFVALISGVILAFAIQLVLTNLSVAAGISYLGRFLRLGFFESWKNEQFRGHDSQNWHCGGDLDFSHCDDRFSNRLFFSC